jgi:hypothetical protein
MTEPSTGGRRHETLEGFLVSVERMKVQGKSLPGEKELFVGLMCRNEDGKYRHVTGNMKTLGSPSFSFGGGHYRVTGDRIPSQDPSDRDIKFRVLHLDQAILDKENRFGRYPRPNPDKNIVYRQVEGIVNTVHTRPMMTKNDEPYRFTNAEVYLPKEKQRIQVWIRSVGPIEIRPNQELKIYGFTNEVNVKNEQGEQSVASVFWAARIEEPIFDIEREIEMRKAREEREHQRAEREAEKNRAEEGRSPEQEPETQGVDEPTIQV